jgi:hypothetical protein
MGNLVVCGDSYSIGIGCHDLINEPFGSLLAKKLDKNLINLSKGSSTNLSIFLQVKYAVEELNDIDLVIISPSCYNRTEWFPDDADVHKNLSNRLVNYHEYPPYMEGTYKYIIENPMKSDENYTGEMLTENYHGVFDYVDNFLDKKISTGSYFKKFRKESDVKMRLLKNYYLYFFDERLERLKSMGMMLMAHHILLKNNIPHYFLTYDPEFEDYISPANLVSVSWGEISKKYPDDLKTLHTSWEGQRVVYEKILEKLG